MRLDENTARAVLEAVGIYAPQADKYGLWQIDAPLVPGRFVWSGSRGRLEYRDRHYADLNVRINSASQLKSLLHGLYGVPARKLLASGHPGAAGER